QVVSPEPGGACWRGLLRRWHHRLGGRTTRCSGWAWGPAGARSRRRIGAWRGTCTRTPQAQAATRGSSGCTRRTPRWPTPTSARATTRMWPAAPRSSRRGGRRGQRSDAGRGRRTSAGRTAGHTHALLSRSPGRRPFG
ncbi:hypothetical protein CFC21_100481, partial [Triticum aestivum]